MAKKKGNNYIIDEENKIVKIELNRWEDENLWVIIDLDDFDKIINYPYTWYAKYSANAKGYYACASQYIPELKHARTVLMHQFIMGIDRTAREFNVDHQNHNTLDNRKENLRITNVPNNSKNREKRNSNNKSVIGMYVGVRVNKNGWFSYKLMGNVLVWVNSLMMNLNKPANLQKK